MVQWRCYAAAGGIGNACAGGFRRAACLFAGRNSDKWGLHCPRARWWGVAWPPIMKWLSLQLWRAGGSLVLFGVA